MPETLRFGLSAVIILHGLVHLLAFLSYLELAEVDGLPYKTTVMDGRIDLGDGGVRVFGVLWGLAALGFSAAGIGLLAAAPWAMPILLGSALFSLALTALDWRSAHIGTVVDLLIVAGIVLATMVNFPTL